MIQLALQFNKGDKNVNQSQFKTGLATKGIKSSAMKGLMHLLPEDPIEDNRESRFHWFAVKSI